MNTDYGLTVLALIYHNILKYATLGGWGHCGRNPQFQEDTGVRVLSYIKRFTT